MVCEGLLRRTIAVRACSVADFYKPEPECGRAVFSHQAVDDELIHGIKRLINETVHQLIRQMFNKTFMNKPAAVKNQGSSFANSSLQFSYGLDGATCFYGAVTSLMFCMLRALADSQCDGVMKLATEPHSSSPQQQPTAAAIARWTLKGWRFASLVFVRVGPGKVRQ